MTLREHNPAFRLLTHPGTGNSIWYFQVSKTKVLRQMGMNENTSHYSYMIKHDLKTLSKWSKIDEVNGYILHN